ncbi:MAG: ATP-dependent DNA helicase RecQ, partial [uncultured Thermomicrobiales bacterium]
MSAAVSLPEPAFAPVPAAGADAASRPAPPDGPRPILVSPSRAMRLPAKLRWALVAQLRATGALDEAAALLDEIEADGGKTIASMEERARLAYQMGQPDEAVALLEARVDRSPSNTAWIALGRLLLGLGRVAEAGRIAADLEETGGITVAGFRAEVARASGDFASARDHHERLLAERPDNVTACLVLAGLALDAGDSGDAAARLDEILDLLGESGTAAQLTQAAGLARQLGRTGQATELRARARAIEALRTETLRAQIEDALGEAPLGEVRPAPGARRDDHRAVASFGDGPVAAVRPRRIVGAEPEPEMEPSPADPGDVPLPDEALAAVRDLFGHPGLRPGQAAVIANVLARRDTLATMPTGAGKSLTFQLPAMLLDGTTLVISPLIALMKDQVEGLPPAVRERTALVNSTLAPDELRRTLDRIADGEVKLVYAAPERLRQHAFLRALRSAGVALVVIDEAHCISLWGHDFRPDYLTIPKSLPELGEPPVLAITATATPAMAKQIGIGLGRELDRVRISLFRPNLFLEAHRVRNREEKVAKAVEICRAERGAGIIYVGSRKDADAIAGLLRDRGVGAIPYHAGLDPEVRARNQERFMAGQVRVVVATVAFGMGVDKADVRFIIHLNPPKSLESYAQESGRAGRDGQPARCVLLFAPTDQTNLNRLARRDELDLDTLRRVYAGIKQQAHGRWAVLDPGSLLPPSDEPNDDVDPRVALGILDQAGLLLRHPDAAVSRGVWYDGGNDDGDDTAEAPEGWSRLREWAGLDHGLGTATIRTAEACAALDLSPSDLDRLLHETPGVTSRDGGRAVCLELLPVGGDAATTLGAVLSRAREEARRRIAQVLAYAEGGAKCRHARLAAHLGEALPPCGTVCDVCTGTASEAPTRKRVEADPAAPAPRSRTTAADAMAVLRGVAAAPFPMGKTGLGKLLTGSVESRVRADRTPAFGSLKDLSRSKVEGLIDRLVEDGYLYRDLNHEYKLISLTEHGADATEEDLAGYESATPARSTATAARAADRDDP